MGEDACGWFVARLDDPEESAFVPVGRGTSVEVDVAPLCRGEYELYQVDEDGALRLSLDDALVEE
jgi:hypothetical protein